MLIFGFLVIAFLFGGMVLFSIGFAAIIFHTLPPDMAGPTIRRAFPYFYLFVLGASVIAAIAIFPFDPIAAGLLMLIAATTLPTRQYLMPAINRATDTADKASFKKLHSLSVAITISHILISAWTLIRFIRA